MGTSDLKLNLWLKQRPRLMLCYSKADRGILIGSLLQISKHMSAYRTTYQHSSSCRFLLRWSWRGERRLNFEWQTKVKSQSVRVDNIQKSKKGIRRGLGNEDEGTEAQVQAKAAKVAQITPTWQEPVAESHRELSAGRCLGGEASVSLS